MYSIGKLKKENIQLIRGRENFQNQFNDQMLWFCWAEKHFSTYYSIRRKIDHNLNDFSEKKSLKLITLNQVV